MNNSNDLALLREYAMHNSEAAFQELVSRHINFVYAAALRQTGNPHVAEEITQAVFILLAQKAGKIPLQAVLTGWLFKTTRFTVLARIRAEARRARRQQEFQMQTESQPGTTDELWHQLSPLLDEALATLGDKDRQAVLLRFFENRSLGEVGEFLGIGEDTARKRVSRALEKLHRYFNKHGVRSTSAIIAGTISTYSVHVAPLGLAKTISTVAVAKSATVSVSTLTLIKGALKIMAWSKAKAAVVTIAAVVVATGTTTVLIKNASTQKQPQSNLPTPTWAQFDRRILTDGINNADQIPNAIYTYPDGDENTHRYLEQIMKMFAQRIGPSRIIKSDQELTEQDIQTRTIYIYGSPENHKLFQKVRNQLPILFEDDGIVAGKKKYLGRDVGAIFVCPNPLSPKNRLVVYGTVSPDALHDMNSIFHGPTDYIVFNNATRQFPGINRADQFLVMGSFDKTDPRNWRVDDAMQALPPPPLQNLVAETVVAR